VVSVTPLVEGGPIAGSGGALGWSTVAYVESENLKLLVDTGFYGNRHLLLEALERNGISSDEIDTLFLTHLHFDHCQNFDLFPAAEVLLSKAEYDYVASKHHREVKDTFIPEYVIEHLDRRRLRLFQDELAIDEHLKVVLTPGHTPGSSTLLVSDHEGSKTAVCGDLFKYAWEVYLAPVAPPGTFCGVQQLKESQRKILGEGVTRFLPGHDRPFRFENEQVRYESPGKVGFTMFLNNRTPEETHVQITLPE
jgi:N-acyl homoserine lactone hydrolase